MVNNLLFWSTYRSLLRALDNNNALLPTLAAQNTRECGATGQATILPEACVAMVTGQW